MPVALRADQDFETAERATGLWRSPEMAHEKTLSLPLPSLHTFTPRSNAPLSWCFVFMEVGKNRAKGECFHFNVPGLQLSTGLPRGGPHFPLIYNFHNPAGCILEKHMWTCFAWGLSPENARYGASLIHCGGHLYLLVHSVYSLISGCFFAAHSTCLTRKRSRGCPRRWASLPGKDEMKCRWFLDSRNLHN